MGRLVGFMQRRFDGFHLGFAEYLEREEIRAEIACLRIDAFIDAATPGIRAYLTGSQYEGIAPDPFHALHNRNLR